MTSPDDTIIDCVKLSRPAQRALAQAGIVRFAEITGWTRDAVAALHGVGPKSFTVLDPALAARGLDYKAP